MFDETLDVHPHKKIHIDIHPNAKPVHFMPYPVPQIHLKIFKRSLTILLDLVTQHHNNRVNRHHPHPPSQRRTTVLDLQVRTMQSELHTLWCDQNCTKSKHAIRIAHLLVQSKSHQKQACKQNCTLAGAIKITPRVLNLRVHAYLMMGTIPAKATKHLKSLLVTRYLTGNKKREARR